MIGDNPISLTLLEEFQQNINITNYKFQNIPESYLFEEKHLVNFIYFCSYFNMSTDESINNTNVKGMVINRQKNKTMFRQSRSVCS